MSARVSVSDHYNDYHSQELGPEDLRGEAQGGARCLTEKKQNQHIFLPTQKQEEKGRASGHLGFGCVMRGT